jgi:hypothetical protein
VAFDDWARAVTRYSAGPCPRPLRDGECPERCDLFFQHGNHLASLLIQWGTGDVHHTGVIVGCSASDAGAWLCVEANGPGFELAVKIGADAYAVRVSDDPLVRARLALAACQMPELGVR